MRRLYEELSHLRVPTRTLNMSPRHARIVCDAEHRVSTEHRETLPSLTFRGRKSSSVGQAEMSYQVHQPPAVVCEGFPLISDGLGPLQNQPVTQRTESNGDEHSVDKPPQTPVTSNASPGDNQTSERSARTKQSRRGGTYLRSTRRGSMDVPYTLGLPFKRGSIQRTSRSLPPSVQGQGRSHGQGHQGHGQQPYRRAIEREDETREECEQTYQPAQRSEVPAVLDSNAGVDAAAGQTERAARATESDREVVPSSAMQSGAHSSPSDPSAAESLPSVVPRESPTSSQLSRQPMKAAAKSHELCPLAGTPHRACRYFPCVQPHTYHSLGFHPDPSTLSWRGWIVQNAYRPHHRLAPGRPPPAHLQDGRRTPADAPGYVKRKRLGKEDVVKLDMARKKQAHALARPPSWNTNYGQPTSYRRLRCPVRLKPLT